jgi:hypothetical protein
MLRGNLQLCHYKNYPPKWVQPRRICTLLSELMTDSKNRRYVDVVTTGAEVLLVFPTGLPVVVTNLPVRERNEAMAY